MRGRAGAARLVRRDLGAGDATPAPHPAESDSEGPEEPPTAGEAGERGDSEPPLEDDEDLGPAHTDAENRS
jgi:hypothetical protein